MPKKVIYTEISPSKASFFIGKLHFCRMVAGHANFPAFYQNRMYSYEEKRLLKKLVVVLSYPIFWRGIRKKYSRFSKIKRKYPKNDFFPTSKKILEKKFSRSPRKTLIKRQNICMWKKWFRRISTYFLTSFHVSTFIFSTN